MILHPFLAPLHVIARPNPKAALADYLARVFPSRGHGATDCGEMMDGMSDADHMIQWLAERGIAVVDVKARGR